MKSPVLPLQHWKQNGVAESLVFVKLFTPISCIAVECYGVTETSFKQSTFSITFTSPHFVSPTMLHPCLLCCHISKIQLTATDKNNSSRQCEGRFMKVRGYFMVTGYREVKKKGIINCGCNINGKIPSGMYIVVLHWTAAFFAGLLVTSHLN